MSLTEKNVKRPVKFFYSCKNNTFERYRLLFMQNDVQILTHMSPINFGTIIFTITLRGI